MSCSFLQFAVLHWFPYLFVMSISAFERNISRDQLCPCLTCRQVLHLCKAQSGRGGREAPPYGADGVQWLGKLKNVINTACTLTTEEILSEAQGGVWARTCSPGKELPSFRVRATCHAQPNPQWAAVPSLCVVCTAFLSRMIFGFFTKLILFNRNQKWLRSFWVLFPYKAVRQRKCRSALCGAADPIVKVSSESSGEKTTHL